MLRGAQAAGVIGSILAYSFCSMAMIIFNKLVIFSYGLNYPMGLIFIQNTGSVLLVILGKKLGWIPCPDFSAAVAKAWLPLTFHFTTMLWTSMKSLHTMSVPMQTTIKNLAVIFIALGDSYFFKREVTPLMYLSFLFMALGSYVGAKGDMWVTTWGLFWTFANIVATVSYTLYMKRLMSLLGAQVGKVGPVFYNNLLSLPFLLIGAAPSMPLMVRDIIDSSLPAVFSLIFMIFLGSMMTFTVFWCMKETSPTTFSVVGATNKIPLAIAGMFIFDQFPTASGFLGILIAISGGFLYTYASIRSNKNNVEVAKLIDEQPNEEVSMSPLERFEKV